jgi:hypothetical protein
MPTTPPESARVEGGFAPEPPEPPRYETPPETPRYDALYTPQYPVEPEAPAQSPPDDSTGEETEPRREV